MLEFKSQILELMAKGASLEMALEKMCGGAAQFFDGGAVTVMSVDAAGLMHPLAAPSLPPAYRSALEGIPVGPQVGSCGSAIYNDQIIEVDDIESDRRWTLFRKFALPLGFRACTSWPVHDSQGAVIRAVAIYLRDKRRLNATEQAIASELIQLCELAMAREARSRIVRGGPVLTY